jgi:hypothetical protein
MRYTKIALLAFGTGIVLGLVIAVAEIDAFDRVASGLMALALAALPATLAADLWKAARSRFPLVRRGGSTKRRRPPGSQRRRPRAKAKARKPERR